MLPLTVKGKTVRGMDLRETIDVLADKLEMMPVVLHVRTDVD